MTESTQKELDNSLFNMYRYLGGTIETMKAIEDARGDGMDEKLGKHLNILNLAEALKLLEKMEPYLLKEVE